MKHDVFKRTDETSAGQILQPLTYNLIIGLTLCWGFFINWVLVTTVPYEAITSIHPIVFLLGYFVLALSGVALFNRSSNPAVSFLGYNLVVIPFGLVLNLIIQHYDPLLVQDAIRVTGLVTFIMMVLGSLFPAFFDRISRALGMALVIVILVELADIFIFGAHHGIIDWIVAVIFCGYIGYDWARANAIPKTLDNAIDSAAALYIDIINLFARLLRSRRR